LPLRAGAVAKRLPPFFAAFLGFGGVFSIRSMIFLNFCSSSVFLGSLAMTHQMIAAPVFDPLPQPYYEKIGLVLTKWGMLEWRLRETLYAILQISPKHGRLTIGNPRANEILDRILDISSLDKISINLDTLAKLRKLTNDMLEVRNDLAHGVWLKHPKSDEPVLQKITGQYSVPGSSEKIKARIDPQGKTILPSEMDMMARNIGKMTLAVETIKAQIEEQLATQRAIRTQP
jgi:hypothetical protein